MRGQERIKLKRGTNEPTRARKVVTMVNPVNQENLKLNKAKSKQQSTQHSTYKKQ
jgi:hypothetical protein